MNTASLIFKDGSLFEGVSFGSHTERTGEIVFATGMVGYPEALTDPSFAGQILVLTYPLIGNYGVPDKSKWESDKIQVSGLIVSTYNDTPSHYSSVKTLGDWLKDEKIPALEIKDTRYLAKKIRSTGATPGAITFGSKRPQLIDPNKTNLVAQVSVKDIVTYKSNMTKGVGRRSTVVLIDCGAKQNIIHSLNGLGADVIVVPWNFNPITLDVPYDGVLISNGPGDPTMVTETIENVRSVMKIRKPILGICLGNQILTLAAGGTTKKMKFGHRSQNQPCIQVGTKRCFLTTQNHGYVVDTIPAGFKPWFVNANDGTNEGIIHEKYPFMSVQFHPEACPGPEDTGWIFTNYLKLLHEKK